MFHRVEMHFFKWLLVWLVLFHGVDSRTYGKTPTFKKLKKISAFGLFRDKRPPAWERGYIVGYSLDSAKGELHFKSNTRRLSTKFPYPSLIDKLYLDKIPKWSQLIVGRTVLVEFQPRKYKTGRILARTNPTGAGFRGQITVKILNRKKTFDHRKVRLKGMDICQYFEVDCDTEREVCQQIYLTKWLPAPAQYKCSSLEPTEPTEEEVEEEFFFEETTRKKSKSNAGVIAGSVIAGVVFIVAMVVGGVVLRKKFAKRMTSEERLRRQVINEMELAWGKTEEQTLLKRILNQLQSCLAGSKSFEVERLTEETSRDRMKKVDSQTAVEKSSAEHLRSESTNDIKEALVKTEGSNLTIQQSSHDSKKEVDSQTAVEKSSSKNLRKSTNDINEALVKTEGSNLTTQKSSHDRKEEVDSQTAVEKSPSENLRSKSANDINEALVKTEESNLTIQKSSHDRMKKVDSQTAIEKSSSKNSCSENTNDINEALVKTEENNLTIQKSSHDRKEVDSQTAIEKSPSENLRSESTNDINEALVKKE